MYANDIKKQMQEEQVRLKACKTKEDLNNLWQGRQIIVQDGSEWQNEKCDFVEMVGEGERKDWKMKVRTKYSTFLYLKASNVMILTQQIRTTQKESEVIYNHLKANGFE